MGVKPEAHGDDYAIPIDEKYLRDIGADETTLFDMKIEGNSIILKPVDEEPKT